MIVDLHSHILPNIDDGPKTVDLSVELVKLQIEDGIGVAAATPHFDSENDVLDEFLQKRKQSCASLQISLMNSGINFEIKKAAEVFVHPKLLQINQKNQLCIEGTSFMLVEFPWDYWPEWVNEVIFKLQLEGITPILAHTEKYKPILIAPERLYKLVSMGLLVQINASTITKCDKNTKKVFELIKHRLVHIIATDTHSANLRPPHLTSAFKILENKFDDFLVKYLLQNATSIINGITPDVLDPIPFKDKGFFEKLLTSNK
jgi:protein-tyrosine phosphatase